MSHTDHEMMESTYIRYKKSTQRFTEALQDMVPCHIFESDCVRALMDAADYVAENSMTVEETFLQDLKYSIRARKRTCELYDGGDSGHLFFVDVLSYCWSVLAPLRPSRNSLNLANDEQSSSSHYIFSSLAIDDTEDREEDLPITTPCRPKAIKPTNKEIMSRFIQTKRFSLVHSQTGKTFKKLSITQLGDVLLNTNVLKNIQANKRWTMIAKVNVGKNLNRGKEIEFKEYGQEYAQVLKPLGDCRFECYCFDGITRIGRIRGAIKGKVLITIGDIILVGKRDFQDEKVDILHKYTADEANKLKLYGELPNTVVISDTYNNVLRLIIRRKQEKSKDTSIAKIIHVPSKYTMRADYKARMPEFNIQIIISDILSLYTKSGRRKNKQMVRLTSVRVQNRKLMQVTKSDIVLIGQKTETLQVHTTFTPEEGITPVGKSSSKGPHDHLGDEILRAAENMKPKAFRGLLNHDVDVNYQDKNGITAMMAACRKRRVEIVRLLLNQHADVDIQSSTGNTALIEASAIGQCDVMKILLDRGAKVNIQNHEGRTALMYAVVKGKKCVMLLLEHGADMTISDKYGMTAKDSALRHGDMTVMNILKEVRLGFI